MNYESYLASQGYFNGLDDEKKGKLNTVAERLAYRCKELYQNPEYNDHIEWALNEVGYNSYDLTQKDWEYLSEKTSQNLQDYGFTSWYEVDAHCEV